MGPSHRRALPGVFWLPCWEQAGLSYVTAWTTLQRSLSSQERQTQGCTQELGGCISALLSLFLRGVCVSQSGSYTVRANGLLLHFQHRLSLTHILLVPHCRGSAAGLAIRMLRRLFSSSRKVCAGVGMEASPFSLHPSQQPAASMLRAWEMGQQHPGDVLSKLGISLCKPIPRPAHRSPSGFSGHTEGAASSLMVFYPIGPVGSNSST